MRKPGALNAFEVDIMTASRIMVNILAESLMHVGEEHITAPQFRILDMIRNLTDKPTEIAGMLGVKPSAVSFLLDKLEEKGMVERKLGTSDRRRIELALTKKGKKSCAAQTATGRSTSSWSCGRWTRNRAPGWRTR